MRKRVDGLDMDAPLAAWAADALRARVAAGEVPAAVSDGARELVCALDDLASGATDALLLAVEGAGPERAERGQAIVCGALTIDPRARRVLRDGEQVALTPKEFDILWFLARNRGEVFTKEQIYRAVWGDDYLLDAGNVMAFIRKLRKKIEPAPDAPVYILTIWGVGYTFTDELG